MVSSETFNHNNMGDKVININANGGVAAAVSLLSVVRGEREER